MPTANDTISNLKALYANATGMTKQMLGQQIAKLESASNYEENYSNAYDALSTRIKELSDPTSSLYSKFRSSLVNSLSGLNSTNAQLATTVAQGGSFVQAQEKIKAMQAQVNDKAISGTESYYLNNQSGINSLLGQQASLSQNYVLSKEQMMQQQQQYEDQQNSSLWSNIIGGAASLLPLLSTGSSGSTSTPTYGAQSTPTNWGGTSWTGFGKTNSNWGF